MPLYSLQKVAVNGPQAHEVFKLLKGEHTVLADACKDDHPECEGFKFCCPQYGAHVLVACNQVGRIWANVIKIQDTC